MLKNAQKHLIVSRNQPFKDHSIDWPHGLKNIIRDMHAHGFPVSIFKSELDLQGLKILKTFHHEACLISLQFRINHLPNDFNKYSYKNLVALDESINIDFLIPFKIFKAER